MKKPIDSQSNAPIKANGSYSTKTINKKIIPIMAIIGDKGYHVLL